VNTYANGHFFSEKIRNRALDMRKKDKNKSAKLMQKTAI
jgi:hypothetical protein